MLSTFPFLRSRSVIPDCFLICIPNRSVGSGGILPSDPSPLHPMRLPEFWCPSFPCLYDCQLELFFSSRQAIFFSAIRDFFKMSFYSVFPLLETYRGGSLQFRHLNFLAWTASPSHLDSSVPQLYLLYLTLNYVSHPPAVPICCSLNKSGIFNISMLLDLPSHGLKGSFCLWGSFSHLGRIISLRKPLNSSGNLKVSFSIALPGTCFHYWIRCIIL